MVQGPGMSVETPPHLRSLIVGHQVVTFGVRHQLLPGWTAMNFTRRAQTERWSLLLLPMDR